ncbi:unnamed protein product, partial [marine sediment metagenome]
HKLDEFIKYTYSLKLLEYLACGKPVVTTSTPETKEFSDVIYIAKDYADFSKKIDSALKNDTIELQKQRIEQVKKQDWDLKINQMMKYIDLKISKL